MLGAERDYAEAVAQVYHGEIASYSDGIAVINITDVDITVSDVIHAMARDETLPFVEPNYNLELEPEIIDEAGSEALEGVPLSKVSDWNAWVYDVFKDNADPFIKYPSLYEETQNRITGIYQWHHTFMDTYKAWNAAMGDGINVAVIDMSVNENHEDLAGSVILDDVCEEKYYGEYGHGTQMAGIIAAREGNAKGGAGIAPHARIIGINVFDSEQASSANMIRGINRAVERGRNPDGTYDNAKRVHIINMSLGKNLYIQEEAAAVKRALDAGITVVAAAGNEHSNFLEYPGCFDGVICVGAVDMTGARAGYSNFGPQVTIAAPGSTIAAPITTSNNISDTTYRASSGTSHATAVTSGFLALYMSKFGMITPKESLAVLKKNAVPGPDNLGAGIITFKKMFDNDKAEPVIAVYDKDNNRITNLKNPVPEGSRIFFFDEQAGNNDVIVFTTDGELPAIKNGEVVNGEVYDPQKPIEIDAYEAGSEITVKAIIVNSLRVASKAATVRIKTPAPKPAAVKIKTVELNLRKSTLKLPGSTTVQLSITKLIDAKGARKNPQDVDYQWLSSNPDVAEVDANGLVTAVGAGTSKIYVKILDGSNKTASCLVTVNTLVKDIEIIGISGMSQKSSTIYRAEVYPADAKNKRVTWSLPKKVAGVSINSLTGQVTVGAKVPVGTEFTIQAKANDEGAVTKAVTIKVVKRAKKVTITSDDSRAVKDKTGAVTSASIFSADIPDEGHPYLDNVMEVKAVIAENDLGVDWSTSNPAVATVEVDEKTGRVFVVGHKEGRSVISAKAIDGSGKKASFTMKVIVPVSMLMMEMGDDYVISAGNSVNVGKMLHVGKTYGEPTSKKVTWSIDEAICLINGQEVDVAAEAIKKKAIAIDQNGKFTTSLKNSLPYLQESSLFVKVRAETKDGTGYWARDTIVVRKPYEYLFFCNPDTSQGISPIGSLTISVPKDSTYATVSAFVFCDQNLNLTATTNKTDVCGAELNIAPNEQKVVYVDPETGREITGYAFSIKYMTYSKRESAAITVNPNDGSRNRHTLRVTIQNE